jgi:hypothetical protein
LQTWLLRQDQTALCCVSSCKCRRRRVLICDKHSDVELFTQFCETTQHDAELLLAICKLTTTRVVDAKERHDGVNDEQTEVAIASKQTTHLIDGFLLLLRRIGTVADNVFERGIRINAESLSNGTTALESDSITCKTYSLLDETCLLCR